MRYIVDNDLHIHTGLSLCSKDAEQHPQNILNFAEENGLKTVCITDHFWDADVPNDSTSNWYKIQNYDHITQNLPLPKSQYVKLLFGCEGEMHRGTLDIGIATNKYDMFDFMLVTTTHFHIKDFAVFPEDVADTPSRVKTYFARFEKLLNSDLPFHKVGISHLTVGLLAPTFEERLNVIENLPTKKLEEVFKISAQKGLGIELNSRDLTDFERAEDIILRPYKIAKQCGCKFFLGSDAHHMSTLYEALPIFNNVIDALGLTEEDKTPFLKGVKL